MGAATATAADPHYLVVVIAVLRREALERLAIALSLLGQRRGQAGIVVADRVHELFVCQHLVGHVAQPIHV
ncbi:hypothetical protein D3C74_457930 [compost metagenome]